MIIKHKQELLQENVSEAEGGGAANVPAAKPEGLNSIPGTHREEKTDCCKLFSLSLSHTYIYTHTLTHTHTYTHKTSTTKRK